MGTGVFRRPSPALVVSTLALTLAIGGGSYAAASGGDKASDKKIAKAEVKALAPKLSVAHAGSADTLQGKSASSFASATLEAPRVVGAAGQPAFENGWFAAGGIDEGLSFYKDPWGIVHLQGNTAHTGASASAVFTLPAGYRPAKNLYFAVYGAGGQPAFMAVNANGDLVPESTTLAYLGLSNISFRAGT